MAYLRNTINPMLLTEAGSWVPEDPGGRGACPQHSYDPRGKWLLVFDVGPM